MKRLLACLVILTALAAAAAHAQPSAPREIAGIALGADVKDLAQRLDLSKAVPLWDKPYLTRANIQPTKGFRTGYVLFGNCANPGRIVRIKLKYQDKDPSFFRTTGRTLTTRYGDPKPLMSDQGALYLGMAWKFGNIKTGVTALLLEHAAGDDPEDTEGTSIRLTDNAMLDLEHECYEKTRQKEPQVQPSFPLFEIKEDWLLPK